MTEHQHIEWKETWRDDYLRWLCGFANADGGVLVLGRDDKLVLWNPGVLPQESTIQNQLGKHPSCPFNPLVANAFFRAGYIESWGRGIEKIRQECLGHGIEPPVYDSGMAGLMVTFHANPEHLARAVEAGDPTQKTSVKTLGKTLGMLTKKSPSSGKTTQETTQETILALLKKTPKITRRRLAELVRVSDAGVKYHLDKLRSQGIIRHVGPTKSGHWEVINHE